MYNNMYDELYDDGMIISSVTDDERTWAKLAHLSAIIAMLISANSLSFLSTSYLGITKRQEFFCSSRGCRFVQFQYRYVDTVVCWYRSMFHYYSDSTRDSDDTCECHFDVMASSESFFRSQSGRLHYYPFQLKILS